MKDWQKTSNCCFTEVHNCLLESFALIMTAKENYFNPLTFIASVNAAIQSLRNITFRIQNLKADIVNFDEWYKNWQTTLKSDKMSLWIHDSRTKIVHQEGLKMNSMIRIGVSKRNNEFLMKDYAVDPFVDLDTISKVFVESCPLTPDEKKDALLIVERLWVDDDFLEHDVIDILAYNFVKMEKMLSDLHVHCGMKNCQFLSNGRRHSYLAREQDEIVGPSCFVMSNLSRTVWVRLDTGEKLTKGLTPYSQKENLTETALKRYPEPEIPDYI